MDSFHPGCRAFAASVRSLHPRWIEDCFCRYRVPPRRRTGVREVWHAAITSSFNGAIYTHHGIDLGDGTVIHFSGGPDKSKMTACVCRWCGR